MARGRTGRSALALCFLWTLLPASGWIRDAPTAGGPHGQRFSLPVVFVPNRGQAPPGVRFVAEIGGLRVYVSGTGLSVAVPGQTFSRPLLRLLHPDAGARVRGLGRLPGRVSYFLGGPRRWRVGLPTFASVVVQDLYPGIDLIIHRPSLVPAGLTLTCAWLIRSGGDVRRIHFVLPRQAMTDRGLPATRGSVRAFQPVGGVDRTVSAQYVIRRDGVVGLRLARYERRRTLVVDPVIRYALLLGGSSWDYAAGVSVDRTGNVYVTGATGSSDFPLRHAVQRGNQGGLDDADAFVAKLSPSGKTLLYATYLGGGADDAAAGIAVDRRGQAYVTGFTESSDFPARQPVAEHRRCNTDRYHAGDAFAVKLAPSGSSLVYSTCLGGSAGDWGTAVTVHGGQAYIAGTTASRDFPRVRAPRTSVTGRQHAFVAGISAGGGSLLFSRLLGGDGDENANAIAGGDGALWVAGASTPSAAVDPLQGVRTGNTNAFLVRLSLDGRRQLGETHLGGGGDDVVSGVAVGGGRVCLAGATTSTGFPVRNAVQQHATGRMDAFVSCFDSSRIRLVASTYLGGDASTRATGVALDGIGDVWITGGTTSPDFPTSHPVQGTLGGGQADGDAIVAELPVDGGNLLFGTYLGGQGEDIGEGIAVAPNGDVVVVGGSSSLDFPLAGPPGRRRPPHGNAFVAALRGAVETRRGG